MDADTHDEAQAGGRRAWGERLLHWGLALEGRIDHWRAEWAGHFGRTPDLFIQTHIAYGTAQRVTVAGRVLADPRLVPAQSDDSQWDNLRGMLRRFESDEQPNARVQVEFSGAQAEGLTDGEGYFRIEVSPAQPPDAHVPWHFAEVRVLGGSGAAGEELLASAEAPVLIPPPTARFGVISDIDDTILVSDAPRKLHSARLMLLGNALSRVAFGGVAALYSALQAGAAGDEHNPIFYVSSSPWNIFDFLIQFMQVNDIPVGPITLRDYGLDEQALASFEHGAHKLSAIRRILATYPGLPFLLIGDSGQQDPEIYAQIARAAPERILAIYIRDVSSAARDAQVQQVAADLRAQGIDMLFMADSAAAARHAAARGWIAPAP